LNPRVRHENFDNKGKKEFLEQILRIQKFIKSLHPPSSVSKNRDMLIKHQRERKKKQML